MRKSNIQLSFALLVILEFVIALLTFEDLGLGFIPLLFNPGVHLIFGYIGLSLCLKNDERGASILVWLGITIFLMMQFWSFALTGGLANPFSWSIIPAAYYLGFGAYYKLNLQKESGGKDGRV